MGPSEAVSLIHYIHTHTCTHYYTLVFLLFIFHLKSHESIVTFSFRWCAFASFQLTATSYENEWFFHIIFIIIVTIWILHVRHVWMEEQKRNRIDEVFICRFLCKQRHLYPARCRCLTIKNRWEKKTRFNFKRYLRICDLNILFIRQIFGAPQCCLHTTMYCDAMAETMRLDCTINVLPTDGLVKLFESDFVVRNLDFPCTLYSTSIDHLQSSSLYYVLLYSNGSGCNTRVLASFVSSCNFSLFIRISSSICPENAMRCDVRV